MIIAALALVVTAAVLHAAWNLMAKRVDATVAFVWLLSLCELVVLTPVALVLVIATSPSFDPAILLIVAGSAVLQTIYFVTLQRGYREGDLSVVYPMARGTGAMLAAFVGILVLAEPASPLSLAGVALAGGGVLALTRRGGGDARRGALFGLAVGLAIASYTLWDKHAVDALALSPVLLVWGQALGQSALLAPVAGRRSGEVRRVWREYRREVIGVAIVSPLAYILVLYALAVAPVSYVAPAREISIVIGVALGARVLGEENGTRRILAGLAIVGGVLVLTAAVPPDVLG